jgi:hypothetical protein
MPPSASVIGRSHSHCRATDAGEDEEIVVGISSLSSLITASIGTSTLADILLVVGVLHAPQAGDVVRDRVLIRPDGILEPIGLTATRMSAIESKIPDHASLLVSTFNNNLCAWKFAFESVDFIS